MISSSVGWGVLARERHQGAPEGHSFLEGLSLLGMSAAALILMQLERLLTPPALDSRRPGHLWGGDHPRRITTAYALQRWERDIRCSRGSAPPLPQRSARGFPHRKAWAVALIAGSGSLLVFSSAAPWVAASAARRQVSPFDSIDDRRPRERGRQAG